MNADDLRRAIRYNADQAGDGELTPGHNVRLVQFWQEEHDLFADGQAGPMTQLSLEQDMKKRGFGEAHVVCLLPSDKTAFVDGKWLIWDGPETGQPKNYRTAKDFFGDPETSPRSNRLDKSWYKKNIVELHGSRALPGVPAKWYFKIHRRVEPYIREGLRRALLSCPYRIGRIGGFVFRHIRNDPRRNLSMHALGGAFDIDSKRNRGLQFKRGKSPKAWTPEYYKIWPDGVPEEFVQALSSCGFAWGNDWDEDGSTDDHRWLDPMHFEWIARDGNQFEV